MTPGLQSQNLTKISYRYLLQHPLHTGLTLLGIMLGVAIVVAIDLANFSAKRAFTLSMEMISGTATHYVQGGNQGIPENVYERLRTERGMRDSAPLVSDEVRIGTQRLTVLGVDMFARNFAAPVYNAFQARESSSEQMADIGRRLLLEPNTVALTKQTAQEIGVRHNEVLSISYRGKSGKQS